MLRRIVVPLDGSGFGEQALPTAVRLAERDRAMLEIVHVFELLPMYGGAPVLDPSLELELRRDRAAYVARITTWLQETTSVTVRKTVLEGDRVAQTLAEFIAEEHADLVVMATHGRGGLSRLWLGSVAQDLVRRSSAPVLLIRPTESGSRDQPPNTFKHVLLPLDGWPESEEAVDHAVAVAADPGVEFELVHVVPPVVYIAESTAGIYPTDDDLQEAQGYLDRVADRIRARGFSVETHVLKHPQPARAILGYVEEHRIDLIAMDTYGKSVVERKLLGSVTDKMLRASPVPVLVHRLRTHDDDVTSAAASSSAAKAGARTG